MGGERDEQQSCRRAAEPSEHLRAAFEFCHEVEAESHSADRGQAVECVGNQRTFAGKASLREDLRAVIHDGVDTGQLCEDGDADADEHDAADPWCREVAVGDLVFYGLFLQHVLYLIEFSNGAFFARADDLEDAEGIRKFSLHEKPARAFWQPKHTEEKHESW